MPDEQKNTTENDIAVTPASDVIPDRSLENAGEISAIESQLQTTEPLAEVPQAPVFAPAPPMDQRWQQPLVQPVPKKRRIWVAVLAVILILAAASGGSWAAYALWYQNPDKVLIDAFTNAYKSKSATLDGTVNIDTAEAKIALTINEAQSKTNGSHMSAQMAITDKKGNKFTFEGEAIYTQDATMYYRVKNLKQSYDKGVDDYIQQQIDEHKTRGTKLSPTDEARLKQQLRKLYDDLLGAVLNKIDNRWIKVSVADLKELSPTVGKEYECSQGVIKKAMNSHKIADQFADIYSKNKFVLFKENLGVKDGNLGYVIDIDNNKAKKFGDEIKKTDIYKELEACTKTSGLSSSESNNNDTVDKPSTSQTTQRMEIWVNQWSHELSHINAAASVTENKQTEKFDMSLSTKFNTPVTIDVPKEGITLKELSDELQKIFSTVEDGGDQSQAVSSVGTV